MTFIQVQAKIKFDARYELTEDTDDRDDIFCHYRFYFSLGFFLPNAEVRILVIQTNPRNPRNPRKETIFSKINVILENTTSLAIDILQML